jgi:Domain of unknown function (DUF1707)
MEQSCPQPQPSAATTASDPGTGRSEPGTGTSDAATGGSESGTSGSGPAIRASDQDRDAAAQRLQAAFAEGRLDDGEFDERMRAALTARTGAELDRLTTDLPAEQGVLAVPADGEKVPGRLAIALKGSLRRGGRWRVPGRVTSVIYKGSGWLDLRAAELTAPLTKITAVAYKSRIDILVPPGVRVEVDGPGVSNDGQADQDRPRLPRDAPAVHVRGFAYRGAIEVGTRPPSSDLVR